MARPTNQLREFARVGAQARLQEIQAEVAAIRREFPELRTASAKAASPAAASAEAPAAAPKKRRTMSKAARAKIAAAQRARWARVRAGQ